MKFKRLLTSVLTVIMISTPCASVFAGWGRRHHHRPWKHHRRSSDWAPMFSGLAGFTTGLALAGSSKDDSGVSELREDVKRNRDYIRELEDLLKKIMRDRDKELDEMKDRIREVERNLEIKAAS